jgi:tetratricopeptide (TPR) repeat protein
LLAVACCKDAAESRPAATDAEIALGNLNAQIAALDGALNQTTPLASDERTALIDRLLTRGRFLGRIADYERAADLGDRFVREEPTSARSYLLRARTRSSLHRFPAVLADLDEAERLGLRGDPEVTAARIAVLQATGRYLDAEALRSRGRSSEDVASLGLEAIGLGERGRFEEAERLFARARATYRGVSPFAVAWLYYHQGTMWRRAGSLERARELLDQAHSAFPKYAAAATQLAEVEAQLGGTERAISLLRDVVQVSDDPDPMAQLAKLLEQSGRASEAARFRNAATTRFEELTERHREAFADHAAEFWLGPGGDPQRALGLARYNLDVRRTPAAYALLIETALVAGDQALACRTLHGLNLTDFPVLRPLVSRTSRICRGDR